MKRILLWTGLGLLALLLYFVFLLVFAPADYAARGLAHVTRGAVTIDEARGSLWSGSGTLNVRPPGGPAVSGRLRWTLSPWTLLVGRANATLEFDGQGILARGKIDASMRRYAVSDFSATLPAETATALYPAVAILGLGGTFRVTTPAFALTPEAMEGTATLQWQGASSRMLRLPSSSDFQALITGQGKNLVFQVSTLQGVLRTSGRGTWRAMEDGVVQFQGNLLMSPPQPNLEPMLNAALGRAGADGQWPIDYEFRLAPLRPFP